MAWVSDYGRQVNLRVSVLWDGEIVDRVITRSFDHDPDVAEIMAAETAMKAAAFDLLMEACQYQGFHLEFRKNGAL
jgi:hypothetical protein